MKKRNNKIKNKLRKNNLFKYSLLLTEHWSLSSVSSDPWSDHGDEDLNFSVSDLPLFPLCALPEATNSAKFQIPRSFQTDDKMPGRVGINYQQQSYLFLLAVEGAVTQLSLDAEGRIQLPKQRCLLLFGSPAVAQRCVWDGWYDLGGHLIPTISQETLDLSKVDGEHERDPSNEIPPRLVDGWAEVLGAGPTVTERQNFGGALGEGRAFSSHFKKTPLVGLKKLQLARA